MDLFVLASGSPRRRMLLERSGLPFRVECPAGVSEDADARAPAALVVELARRKARAVEGPVVVGADTVVALDGRALGKPRDRAEARSTLARLSGRAHEVWTGLCVRRGALERTAAVRTRVVFRPIPPGEIDSLVAAGLSDGKAGAYGLQDEPFRRYVACVDGPEDNVIGLPVETLRRLLDDFPEGDDET